METRSEKQIKKDARRQIREIKRKTEKPKFPLLFLCLFLIGLLGILLLVFGPFTKEKKEHPAVEEKKEPVEVVTSLSLAMVGDNLIHSSVYKEANKQAGYNGYNFKPLISYVKEIVKEYDLAYYNQETILGGTALGLSDYPTFNSPQEAGDAMIDAGFNLVSLATNHTMDRGEKAVRASLEYWDKQEGILAVGNYASEEEREKVKILKKNDISYTMLNYTYGTNGMPIPSGKDYLCNVWPTDLYINDPSRDTKYQAYKETVKADIEKVRKDVDVLIVAMHWGEEYTHEPTAYEKDMAKYLASLGVDIIIGTHPHVIQPITFIDNTVVFYSLGNFISAQYQNENYNKMVEILGSLTITKRTKGDESKIEISDVKAELLYNYYNQATWRGFKVVPFSHPDIKNYLPNYKTVYERYKNIVQKYDDIEVAAVAE